MFKNLNCLHENVHLVLIDKEKQPKSPHYGKLICVSCNKFVNWIKNPDITKKMEDRDRVIDLLIENNQESLTPKSLSLLYSIKGKRFISPNQEKVFNSIRESCNLNQ